MPKRSRFFSVRARSFSNLNDPHFKEVVFEEHITSSHLTQCHCAKSIISGN